MGRFGGRDGWTLFWVLFGVAITVVVAVALSRFFGTLLFAVFLYYATRPLYRRLNEHVDHPDVAVTLTILAVVVPILVVLGYAAFLAFHELDQFLATRSLEGYRSYFQPYLGLAREGRLQQLWNATVSSPGQPLDPAVRDALGGLFGRVTTAAQFAFTVLSRLFLMVVFLFYLLRDDHRLRAWFYDSIDRDERVVEFASKVDDDLQTVFFGNLAIVAVTSVLATGVYFALNVLAGGPLVTIPVLLGLLTGIGTLIPIVGMKLVYLPYAVYLGGRVLAAEIPLWYPAVFLGVAALVVDVVPDFFIRSYLSARSSVPMGLIFLAYVVGVMAFGWMGLFLGPLVVVFLVHFARDVFPQIVDEFTAA